MVKAATNPACHGTVAQMALPTRNKKSKKIFIPGRARCKMEWPGWYTDSGTLMCRDFAITYLPAEARHVVGNHAVGRAVAAYLAIGDPQNAVHAFYKLQVMSHHDQLLR